MAPSLYLKNIKQEKKIDQARFKRVLSFYQNKKKIIFLLAIYIYNNNKIKHTPLLTSQCIKTRTRWYAGIIIRCVRHRRHRPKFTTGCSREHQLISECSLRAHSMVVEQQSKRYVCIGKLCKTKWDTHKMECTKM